MQNSFDSRTLPQAVRALFEQNNFLVQGPVKIHGAEVDLVATPLGASFGGPVYIEATIEYVDNDKFGKDATKFLLIRKKEPNATLIIVSSSGFSLPVRERATQSRIETLTYDALLARFSRFEPYIKHVLESGELAGELRALQDVYEEPYFEDKIGHEFATPFLENWVTAHNTRNRWLIIIGDYGTGKTALTKIVQYRWLARYIQNPSFPVPFRIELRDFTRQFNADGLLHHFLDSNRLGHIPLPFITSLIRTGRIVLLLDGYDEMAQFMNSRERRTCLEALAQLSTEGAKGILTSRPNYFTEAEEFQVFDILYSSFSDGAYRLSDGHKDILDKERQIDNLLQTHFLDRYERALKDLTPEQTEALVARHLSKNQQGFQAVMSILRRVFRSSEEGSSASLSGKPVIISYLLEIVDELKETSDDQAINEWQIYEMIMDNLMLRDLRRSPTLTPNRRRAFLRSLSLLLSKKDNPLILEPDFRDLVRKQFSKDLRYVFADDKEQQINRLFDDLRSSSTLTRVSSAAKQGWKFSHNSLREYLLTEHLMDCLDRGLSVDENLPISDPMRIFVASRGCEAVKENLRQLAHRWPNREHMVGTGSYLR